MNAIRCAAVAAVLICGASDAEASYWVKCTMKARVLKVLGPVKDGEVKTKFRVLKILSHGGHSSTLCNKFKGKKLVRNLVLPSPDKKPRKGRRVRIRYRVSEHRGQPRSESWYLLEK